MFKLKAEDLSHLGGPMGTEHTPEMFTRYFSTIDKAKEAAKQHYKGKNKLSWIKRSNGGIRSPDLGYVMYYISEVKVES